MPTTDYLIPPSFVAVPAGRQKNPTRWTVLNPTHIFDAISSGEAATEVIRNDIRSYRQGSYLEHLNSCIVDAAFNSSDWSLRWTSHAPVFRGN